MTGSALPISDVPVTSDSGGTALGSIVAIRMKKGFVLPCMDAPAGRCVVIGFDMADGKLVDEQVKKIKDSKGSIVKTGFHQEGSSKTAKRTLFRGIPVENVNIL